MRGHGKHRRPRNTPLTRGIAVAGLTGSAALALPLTGAGAAAAAVPATTPIHLSTVAVAKQTPARAASLTHAVVKGDTLSKIARKYSVSGGWKSLYQANRAVVGADPGLIHPGQKLSLTTAGATKTATKTVKKAAAKAAAKTVAPAVARAVPAVATSAPKAATAAPAASYGYADNLEGWIRESLDVMARQGIPGTFDGIYRNVMRESSGNPRAVNDWDSNAAAGTPSKGLLQVIDPTFQAYHVAGTSLDPYDPVANIVAACNYAADRYGSIDNVFGAY
ncbi:LysM peptidoglycan-binding domain-containing protein [Streptomyces sp. NPDC090025]|uniref:LysM peptidoglycan-binding domain-containing protein n=1 Tax=Streptomyces sp. NPDC090025 TaxID=3365922 RepID=UPI003837C943